MIDTATTTTCKHCKKPIVHIPGHRRREYCNDTCKQMAYRERVKEGPHVTIADDSGLAELEERLAQAELGRDQVQQRFAEYVQTTNERLANLTGELATRRTRITELERQVEDLLARQSSAEQKSTRRKKPPKPQPLPADLAYWRHFANKHNVPQNEVLQAMKAGFVHYVKGDWMVESGFPITEALDEKGRRDFWVQFHTRDKFRTCESCPHTPQL